MTPSLPSVLFVDHSSVLGGAELYLLDVAKNYPNARVLLFEDGPFRERLDDHQIPVSLLGAGSSLLSVSRDGGVFQSLRALPSLFRLVARLVRHARTADVLFANSQKALAATALAGWIGGVPVIWNLHDILSPEHFSPLRIRFATFLANQFVDHVVVNSTASLEAFVAAGGNPSRVSIVYNGIDRAPFDAVRTDSPEDVRAELGIGATVPLVGVFSRLAPWKGQHVLLESLAEVPSLHALIVGDALFQDEERYAETLREQVDRLNLTDRVHFLGFREDVPRLLSAVDVVAHTSVSAEPFGRVIVEGMLAGRPVVATKAGGALEIIEDGEHGRLVHPDDGPALAAALHELFNNPEYASRLASAGRERARALFSVDRMIRTLTTVITTVARS